MYVGPTEQESGQPGFPGSSLELGRHLVGPAEIGLAERFPGAGGAEGQPFEAAGSLVGHENGPGNRRLPGDVRHRVVGYGGASGELENDRDALDGLAVVIRDGESERDYPVLPGIAGLMLVGNGNIMGLGGIAAGAVARRPAGRPSKGRGSNRIGASGEGSAGLSVGEKLPVTLRCGRTQPDLPHSGAGGRRGYTSQCAERGP